jgi:hypothetical protein
MLVFVVLSLCDLVLTCLLLERFEGGVCEANPIAQWCLRGYGWFGLALFKTSMVLLVLALTQIISRWRPGTSRHLLDFGCTILAAVVFYSAAVGRTAQTSSEIVAKITAENEESNRQAHQKSLETIAYAELVTGVSNDLIAGKSTLAEAVARLMESPKNQDPARQKILMMLFPGRTIEQSLALHLFGFVRHLDAASWRVSELEEQYQSLFGCPVHAQDEGQFLPSLQARS